MVYFVSTRTGPEDSWKGLCARGVKGRDSTEVYAEERVWSHISSAYGNKGKWDSSQDPGLWEKQLTLIKLSRFAQLSQPTRFANPAEAVAASPFVSFLSASPQQEQGTCGEPLVPGLNSLLGKGAPVASTQAFISARKESRTKRCHSWVLLWHVQWGKKQPQSPSGTSDKEW